MGIRKIIREEVNDFGWAKDFTDAVDYNELKSGQRYDVGHDGDMIVSISTISNGIVYYSVRTLEDTDDEVTFHHREIDKIEVLIKDEYWVLRSDMNESNDFDWADDIQPFNLDDCKWIIQVNGGEEWREVEQMLHDNQWYWYGDERSELGLYEGNYHFFFSDDCDDKIIDAANDDYFYDTNGERSGEFEDHRFYTWSDIKGLM